MKSFKKLYTDLTVKEKENFLSLKPEEMVKFANENECDTDIEEISSLLNSKTPFGNELSEEELSAVSGGVKKIATDGAYYKFTGDYNKERDYNNMFLCPYCGGKLHWGSWSRWYCDPCNTSWYEYSTSSLKPNLSSGLWKNISKDEYYETRSFSPGGR